MRLFLTSTPRSGNTWFRKLLASSLNLAEAAVHTPEDVHWDTLPGRVILQLHWPATIGVRELIAQHGFCPVTIVRHPLDVLLSILHFCRFEPETASWLQGRSGSEAKIQDCSPADERFLQYATGPRATELLNVSVDWLAVGSTSVVYEKLVANPSAELAEFLPRIQLTPTTPVNEVAEQLNIHALRATSNNNHFWQGRPGLWKDLIDKATALEIQSAQARVFKALKYDVEGAVSLDRQEIERRWDVLRAPVLLP